MDGTGVMRSADLQAVRLFERDSPPGSDLLSVGFGDLPSIPPSSTASRSTFSYAGLADRATQRPGRPRASDVSALLERYQKKSAEPSALAMGRLYLVWSPVLSLYAEEYGLARRSQSTRWLDLLLASPALRLIYTANGTYLFRSRPPNLVPASTG
jgi:predicted phage gp36 major capsid-like protein